VNVLTVKLFLMPLVMATVTLVSRKWGNTIGGLVASLPWIAGPIFYFFCIEQGQVFALKSIKGTMIGTIAIVPFIYGYLYSAKNHKWPLSLCYGYAGFLALAAFLNYALAGGSVHMWYVITLIAALGSIYLYPKNIATTTSIQKIKYEIPLRMIVITAFVIGITYLAKALGPAWSGILTPFPIITAILAAFTHYTQGWAGIANILKGILNGLVGFASFLYLQVHLLPKYGLPASIAIALAVNIVINICMRLLAQKLAK
jgi:hypothetical protein